MLESSWRTDAVVDHEPERGHRAAMADAVLERQRPAVRLGDLAREHEPDPRALRLRRDERPEEVRAVRDAGPVVLHDERQRAVLPRPADANAAVRLERCVDCVAHEVDEQLIELITVGPHRRGWTTDDRDL